MAVARKSFRSVRAQYRRSPLPLHPMLLGRHLLAAVTLRTRSGLRLHLGCGKRRKDGFVNIDLRHTLATDYVGSIVDLPCRPNSVERIETYHVIEHLPYVGAPRALRAWCRALAPGGSLIIECPDFDQAVREYLDGDEGRLRNIFGPQGYKGGAHMFGYNAARLTRMLSDAGFSSVAEQEPTDYHATEEPCLRLEAIK